MPLKYEGFAQVGERIRSYDFAASKECYVEGRIQRISDENGYRAFVIIVDKDGWPGKKLSKPNSDNVASRIGQTIFVPMQIAGIDYDGRIVKLTG